VAPKVAAQWAQAEKQKALSRAEEAVFAVMNSYADLLCSAHGLPPGPPPQRLPQLFRRPYALHILNHLIRYVICLDCMLILADRGT
jgi:hypothetical protein